MNDMPQTPLHKSISRLLNDWLLEQILPQPVHGLMVMESSLDDHVDSLLPGLFRVELEDRHQIRFFSANLRLTRNYEWCWLEDGQRLAGRDLRNVRAILTDLRSNSRYELNGWRLPDLVTGREELYADQN